MKTSSEWSLIGHGDSVIIRMKWLLITALWYLFLIPEFWICSKQGGTAISHIVPCHVQTRRAGDFCFANLLCPVEKPLCGGIELIYLHMMPCSPKLQKRQIDIKQKEGRRTIKQIREIGEKEKERER